MYVCTCVCVWHVCVCVCVRESAYIWSCGLCVRVHVRRACTCDTLVCVACMYAWHTCVSCLVWVYVLACVVRVRAVWADWWSPVASLVKIYLKVCVNIVNTSHTHIHMHTNHTHTHTHTHASTPRTRTRTQILLSRENRNCVLSIARYLKQSHCTKHWWRTWIGKGGKERRCSWVAGACDSTIHINLRRRPNQRFAKEADVARGDLR